jgi:hypothetical protein
MCIETKNQEKRPQGPFLASDDGMEGGVSTTEMVNQNERKLDIHPPAETVSRSVRLSHDRLTNRKEE